ncbi:hypothetical protein NP493_1574g00023 [Ridgeia piscesae]|uniref:Uncharacterized protein n=1 Tax=Ridgeia piscesae TaxID=27915 RepID=A0AAD9NAP4_RIDPI|nr:hypothetical protein NP493_1574g00023 [Ridgeia piscesae]
MARMTFTTRYVFLRHRQRDDAKQPSVCTTAHWMSNSSYVSTGSVCEQPDVADVVVACVTLCVAGTIPTLVSGSCGGSDAGDPAARKSGILTGPYGLQRRMCSTKTAQLSVFMLLLRGRR